MVDLSGLLEALPQVGLESLPRAPLEAADRMVGSKVAGEVKCEVFR